MLSKGFFESIYRESNRLREDCGSGCGGGEEPGPSCGGGCGFRESLHKMNECGAGGVSISFSSCGGGWSSHSSSHSCEIGRRVRIAVKAGCGEGVEVGRLLGYAD